MADMVRDVMTSDPITVQASTMLSDAARVMRDRAIGDVVVLDDGKLRGILTDRDVVVRAVAAERDPRTTRVGDVVSDDMVTVAPTETIDRAVELMREKAVRRLPVVENGRPVGVVSLGDLAVERDGRSVLGQISAATPNS
jgi:CBS domain-containing protein